MISDQTYQQTADVLKLIAHPLRLRILLTLLEQSSLHVSALQNLLGAEPSLLSHHLVKLKDRGLLVSRRQGATIHYALANPVLIRQVKGALSRLKMPD